MENNLVQNPTNDNATPTYNRKTAFIVCALIAALVLVSALSYILGFNNGQNSTNSKAISKAVVTKNISPSPPRVITPTTAPGFMQHINEELGFGFLYPLTDNLDSCTGNACASLERIGLDYGTVDASEINKANPKESLLNIAAVCSADGVGGYIDCLNTKVEEYKSKAGFSGYKVYRTQTFKGVGGGFPEGVYSSILYYFPLARDIKGPGVSVRTGIYFGTWKPLKSNLAELEKIASSFFLL